MELLVLRMRFFSPSFSVNVMPDRENDQKAKQSARASSAKYSVIGNKTVSTRSRLFPKFSVIADQISNHVRQEWKHSLINCWVECFGRLYFGIVLSVLKMYSQRSFLCIVLGTSKNRNHITSAVALKSIDFYIFSRGLGNQKQKMYVSCLSRCLFIGTRLISVLGDSSR